MDSLSIYQQLLGADFERLGPVLRRVHGSAAEIRASGRVNVVHGKGLLVRMSNSVMRVPTAGEGIELQLVIERSENKETWTRSFGATVLKTSQWAKDGYFIEAVGPIQMAMTLSMNGPILRFTPVVTRCLGIKVPKWIGVSVKAEAEEVTNGWRIFVETSSAWLGLMFRYEGFINLIE